MKILRKAYRPQPTRDGTRHFLQASERQQPSIEYILSTQMHTKHWQESSEQGSKTGGQQRATDKYTMTPGHQLLQVRLPRSVQLPENAPTGQSRGHRLHPARKGIRRLLGTGPDCKLGRQTRAHRLRQGGQIAYSRSVPSRYDGA